MYINRLLSEVTHAKRRQNKKERIEREQVLYLSKRYSSGNANAKQERMIFEQD